MPSPFPGMDPYIESQGRWLDFHASLLLYCRDQILDGLSEDYVAQIDEQVRLVHVPPVEPQQFRPDVMVARSVASGQHAPIRPVIGVATLEPVTVPLAIRAVEEWEVRDTRIEILRLPEMRLVTVIERLSPVNKAGSGREEYLEKRRSLIDQPVNLVELDLLLGGRRLPMGGPLPPGDYFALVSRASRRPDSDVYAWAVRDHLPRVPIPLETPDPDVPLDLAAAFATAYERGRYRRILDYGKPLTLPLDAEARAWVEARAVRKET